MRAHSAAAIRSKISEFGSPVETHLRMLLISLHVLLLSASLALACDLPELKTNEKPGTPDERIEVFVSFAILDVLGVSDVNQQIDIDLLGTFRWRDERLLGFDGCKIDVTDVWLPDAILINSSNLRRERRASRNQVFVDENGWITYKPRISGHISTYHELRSFPFDSHDFEIRIGSVDFPSSLLVFVPEDGQTWISDRLNIEGWNIKGVSLSSAVEEIRDAGAEKSVLTLTISVERMTGYYIYRVLLPLLIVVASSWVIFWVPPDRFEFQIGIGVTSMLTVIAFSLSITNSLPPLGYLTDLDLMLTWSVLLVFMSIFEALVAGSLVLRDRKELALKLDVASRIFFPVLLLGGWCAIYFQGT